MELKDVLNEHVDLSSTLYECFEGEHHGSWDDDLTQDELGLIYGVYKMFTGKAHFESSPTCH